jgi:spore maturation protein CgeB
MQGKKVLIVGPNFYGYNQSVARAFSNLGYQTKELGFLDADVEGFKEKVLLHLTRNKEKLFLKKRLSYNVYFKKEYDDYQPDILFLIKGSILQPETVEYARKKSLVILWMMDSIYLNHTSYILRNKVDHIFLFEETEIPKLEAEGIKAYFLPLALDESIYYPIESEKDIDLLFVGALYHNRIELLNKIIKHFPDKKIKIYGNLFSLWRKPFKYFFRKDKHIYTNKNVQPAGLNKLYSRSKVCLNIHHTQSVNGVNQRFFEILGARALQLTDDKLYVKENFSPNDVLIYNNVEELIATIKNVFSNYFFYAEVLQNGYQKVLERHTFTKRVQSLLKTVGIE